MDYFENSHKKSHKTVNNHGYQLFNFIIKNATYIEFHALPIGQYICSFKLFIPFVVMISDNVANE